MAKLIRSGLFDLIKIAVHKCNEEKAARFSAITICYACLAINTKHSIRQGSSNNLIFTLISSRPFTQDHFHPRPGVTLILALVDKRIHHDLNILLAADCDFAKFHAGLALAVLVHDDQLKPQIEFTNPLPELFLRNYLSYDQAEAFREKYCRRYAFGIKNEILERINPLLRCDDGTVQGKFHFRWLNITRFEFYES